jgi:hypothetical protein
MFDNIVLWAIKIWAVSGVEKLIAVLGLIHLVDWLREPEHFVFAVVGGVALVGAVIWAVFKEERLWERLPFGRRSALVGSVIAASVLALALALGGVFRTPTNQQAARHLAAPALPAVVPLGRRRSQPKPHHPAR